MAAGSYVITLNNRSIPPQVIVLTYDDPKYNHAITRENSGCGRGKEDTDIGSIMEYDDQKRLYFSICSIDNSVYYCHGSSRRG